MMKVYILKRNSIIDTDYLEQLRLVTNIFEIEL